MTKRIAIYARVSTDKQSTVNQLLELLIFCTKLGYSIVQEYTDNGINDGIKSAVKLLREKGMGIKQIAREL